MCKTMVVLLNLIKQEMAKFSILMPVSWNYFSILAEGLEIGSVHSFPSLVLTKYIARQQKMYCFMQRGSSKGNIYLGV